MEVPEPRTVTFSGAGGMLKALKSIVSQSGRVCRRLLRAALGLGFRLFFLDDIFAQFSLGGKRAAVDNAKCFFLFMVGQGAFLYELSRLQFITGCQRESRQRPRAAKASSGVSLNLDPLIVTIKKIQTDPLH